MKIVIAPDSYKESLTALEVAESIEKGFRKCLPEAEYIKVPMADGGEGTVQSLVDATGGSFVELKVTGPQGKSVNGFFGLTGDKKTAIIEVAAAAGLHLIPVEERNPTITTSYGVGELIKSALDNGAEKLILGLGGSGTNDAGAGMLSALGAKLLDVDDQEIAFGGAALKYLNRIELTDIDARLSQVEIVVACDVDNPLCGPKGASHIFGPQKGATSEMVLELDDALSHFADVLESQVNKTIKEFPGAGAAGGIGAALVGALNAELRSGIEIVMEAAGLKEQMIRADLVITGEGRIDSQSIHGKTPVGVAKLAKELGLPVIGIAGSVSQDVAVVHEHGIDAVFSVVNGACTLEEAFRDAAANVELTSRNVAAMAAGFVKLSR
ncbi:glycerate kinase [Vibrio sp. HN007]|uniref:glycerate kinase n=1 Tax=Vibrio iocasae TaxID=3098914 RepID=UPI0035D3EC09